MYYWIITLRRALKQPEARGALRSAGLLLLTGVIFYMLIEKWTFVDALYFSVTTLTTVGFGNPAPSTDLGKLFTVFFVLSGVGMFLAVINAVGKAAVQAQLESPRFTAKARRRSGQAGDGSGESASGVDDES
ncbi:MAG: two pore domain potassium channel family protein [Solirubrobacterales bacterium]|nr:two pore domain potassium channel family protein [Solirubrobacterales bacterium]